MKSRGYPIPRADLNQIATLITAALTQDGLDVRTSQNPNIPGAPGPGGLVLEVHRPGSLVAKGTGHAAVMKVWLVPNPAGFHVYVGADRWSEKAAGVMEWLLATPAIVTEGYAAFQQSQVDERVLSVVDHWVVNVARAPVNMTPAAVPTAGACPACRAALPFGARFCPKCALDMQAPMSAACPECKGPVALDATFCPHCGKRLAKVESSGCAKCGTALEPDARFCSSCGTPTKEKP
jgi:hypothetical protein